jgi:hypothetical protein
MFEHGLDRRAASYALTVLFILLLTAVVSLIRETIFVFALAFLPPLTRIIHEGS